ncbi:hypothetical protein LTS18_014089, partial [Coniosporium uncinatum]
MNEKAKDQHHGPGDEENALDRISLECENARLLDDELGVPLEDLRCKPSHPHGKSSLVPSRAPWSCSQFESILIAGLAS